MKQSRNLAKEAQPGDSYTILDLICFDRFQLTF